MTESRFLDARGRPLVAVTGMGAKTPAGTTIDKMWETVCSGKATVARIERWDPSELPVRIAGEVKDFDPGDYFGPKEVRRQDRVTQLGFAAAADALADAGELGADPSRCAVIAATGVGGLETMETNEQIFLSKGATRVSPFFVTMMMPNATAGTIAINFGWTGPNLCICTACAAGSNAIGEGTRMIRDGSAEVVVAGGTEAGLTPLTISAFARMGALSSRNDDPEHASRPFDADRDGFVMSEGAAFMILESLERATARNAHVYGVVLGYGRNDDAHHITAPSPGGGGAAACMQLALDDASLTPADIGHVNAHGTSTPLNDAAEAEAIRKVFGDTRPPVTSSKGVIGHMVGGAGAAEARIALLSLRDGVVPPTANLERLGDDISLDVVTGEVRAVGSKPVLSNSFGFGGHNAVLILAAWSVTVTPSRTPVFGRRSQVVDACLREIDGRTVSWFNLDGGKHRGAIGTPEGEAVERAVRLAVDLGIPILCRVAASGADVEEGIAALHAWGRVARALCDASGVVPVVMIVDGPAVSGPALLLGVADHVIMTEGSFAYVSGPDVVLAFTGVSIERDALGGTGVHARQSGVAAVVVADEDEAMAVAGFLLSFLPSNHLEDPPHEDPHDPVDRDCVRAAAAVPARATETYDVRDVIADVLDHDSMLELRAAYAPNLVTTLACLGGRPVGVIANQPRVQAGSLDINAAQKAARFVQWCDCFNFPVITFVDTSGYLPGKDLEWRGIIRHGAQLLHAYAAATVPRLCVVLRKAYGGAYIVMDSHGLGTDWCAAWPTAEIAVMGGPPAVQILHRRRLDAITDADTRAAEQRALEEEYADRFLNPYVAAERGYVDDVIAADDSRRALAAALDRLVTKGEHSPRRRHSNTPL